MALLLLARLRPWIYLDVLIGWLKCLRLALILWTHHLRRDRPFARNEIRVLLTCRRALGRADRVRILRDAHRGHVARGWLDRRTIAIVSDHV